MDKSESIMIRTRQKWRRHQTGRHLRVAKPASSTLSPFPLLFYRLYRVPNPLVGIEAKRVERSG